LRSVANVALPAWPDAPSHPAAEARAVLETLGRETSDWGVSIGMSRAMQAADRLVPGLAAPYIAWTVFQSLSAAARGDLLRALQTLPATSLMTSEMLRMLADRLDASLPDWMTGSPQHEEIVLVVAALVMLHDLQRQASASPPRTAMGQRVVRWFRQLRSGMNVLGGLRGVMSFRSADARGGILRDPAAVLRVDAGNASHVALEKDPVGFAFPFASQAMRPHGQNDSVVAALGTCLFTGASAHPGTKSRPPPPKSAAKGASRQTSGNKAGRKTAGRRDRARIRIRHRGSHARRHGAQAENDRPPGQEAGGRRPSGSFVDFHVPAKENMAVAHSGNRKKEAPHPVHGTGGRAVPRNDVPAEPADTDIGSFGCRSGTGGLSVDASRPNACRPPPANPGSVTTVPVEAVGWVPACVRFRNADSAIVQVGKTRFISSRPRFCVPAKAQSRFETIFTAPSDASLPSRWMTSLPVQEHLPSEMRQLQIRKYSGLGQLFRNDPKQPTPIGKDAPYSVLTVSLLDDSQLRDRGIPSAWVIPRNTFRLVEHVELGGGTRTYVAYFLNRASPGQKGMKAGFLEVTPHDGGYLVEDDQAGLAFSSDTLDDLVAGIEKISGCRFQMDDHPLPETDDGRPAAALVRTSTLFVNELSTDEGIPPFARQPVNDDLHFLSLVKVDIPGRDTVGTLYHNSFFILGHSLFHVDGEGMLDILHMREATHIADALVLEPRDDRNARFINGCGLGEARPYSVVEIINALEACGMTWAPLREDPDARATLAWASGEQMQPLFSFDDVELRYRDEDGQEGVLWFNLAGETGRNLLVSGTNEPAAQAFALRNDIQMNVRYAADEIIGMLQGKGLAYVPPEQMSSGEFPD